MLNKSIRQIFCGLECIIHIYLLKWYLLYCLIQRYCKCFRQIISIVLIKLRITIYKIFFLQWILYNSLTICQNMVNSQKKFCFDQQYG
ncbi:transmembrane protein, putative (macronuclear) [Tetrahymena thermophila SB210]|uniref:Transmembrane protein, putative n=1 Tax=Tetrahymena thermophila (strain SB210) TaxID=312017 RepID=W7XJC1_TETTS|nr:transmembrane protein, putative [Tetrahymena thermophila SB210]EWS75391.1 transmembrane protein, putative [Tetrahymena thermophila SB210]|eukprot:XP_012652065.1 transmembrane protein, putative [Tetrahymena thermophila SB210]